MQTTDRWTEILAIWKSNQWLYGVVGLLIGLLLFPALQAAQTDLGELLQGFIPEAVGIGFTVLIIDRLYQRREEQRRIRDLQAQLVRDAGSQSNEAAKRAIDELRHHGWLTGEDGLLKGADLSGANLQGVNLKGANLQGAHLWNAHLQAAVLWGVKMQGANLIHSKLQGADLWDANLEDAVLEGAELQGVNLLGAKLKRAMLVAVNLEGTNLVASNLQGTNFDDAFFDQNTRLPDGTYWTPDTDLTRFTDPDHPDFWRSADPFSPAYWGRDQ